MSARRLALAAAALLAASADVLHAEPSYGTIVLAGPEDDDDEGDLLPDGRARSDVSRSDLERRQPRSAPDALLYEPGVFVQKTAHGQGSVFLRGLTGQQTLVLFDGIRLNNSTYRQGPNQYFFTLDARAIDSLSVLRGGASTRYGSDALGGVVLARPIRAPDEADGAFVRPSLFLRATTADDERGGRVAVEGAKGVGFVAGVGARTVGLLESGGPIFGPAGGLAPLVPRFADDGRTQLGTGFDELTADARVTARPAKQHAITAAAYVYRQLDAPRTDQCAPPFARHDECLRYEEQFRTLVYAAWDARPERGFERTRVTLSFQRQHERRRNDRPASFVVQIGEDDVDTVGVTARATTRTARLLGRPARLHLGVDSYFDRIASTGEIGFTDLGISRELSRGQYLDGSSYRYGGAFLDGETLLPGRVVLRAGGRASWLAARAPGDPASGSRPVDRAWFPLVGHVGLEHRVRPWLGLHAQVDRSFRAPNLDDMTSRQQTGPGFQFENPELEPESALTTEVGVTLARHALEVDLWLFRMLLDGAVGKQPREASECPPETPACLSSWSRFQLVNAQATAEIRGVEASARLLLPGPVAVRGTFAWTWGDGPNLVEPPADPSLPYEERVPLSRIPPVNGTVEARWHHRSGLALGAGVRWAQLADRLAIADRSDARIPDGGTPGFVVADLTASYRFGRRLIAALALENLLDAAYRQHGSSVNGPARGLVISVEAAPW